MSKKKRKKKLILNETQKKNVESQIKLHWSKINWKLESICWSEWDEDNVVWARGFHPIKPLKVGFSYQPKSNQGVEVFND